MGSTLRPCMIKVGRCTFLATFPDACATQVRMLFGELLVSSLKVKTDGLEVFITQGPQPQARTGVGGRYSGNKPYLCRSIQQACCKFSSFVC